MKHYGQKGVVLVGCKMDLLHDEESGCSDDQRDMMNKNHQRALDMSSVWNVPFIETSAKRNINVHSLFKQLVYEYWLQTQTRSIDTGDFGCIHP